MDSKVEEFLKDFNPQSRMEEYLVNAITKAGVDGLPKPQSRSDVLLYLLVDTLASGEGGGGGSSDEPVWTEYALDTFAGSVTIENASEHFPDGTYMVKADGSIEADSTWIFKSGSGTVENIPFSGGMEWVYVTYTYINDGMDYIDRLVFDANLPISSLSFAKID